NALPYHMIADGYLDKKNNSFHLNLEARDHVFGKKTQGAPYIVYAPGKYRKAGTEEYQDVRTWNYAVAAGDRLEDSFQLSDFGDPGYHLRIYGPNGFYREFQGNEKDPEIKIGRAHV